MILQIRCDIVFLGIFCSSGGPDSDIQGDPTAKLYRRENLSFYGSLPLEIRNSVSSSKQTCSVKCQLLF